MVYFPGGRFGSVNAPPSPRDRVVIRLQNREPAVHPGMDIALHRNELRLVELLAESAASPAAATCSTRGSPWPADEYCASLVGIDDLQFLTGVQREHVRNILAAFLGEGDGLRRRAGVVRPPAEM